MFLDTAHEQLGWPTAGEILTPSGAGPRVQADLVRRKIEQTLRRLPDGAKARVGLLQRDPSADATEEPLAIVVELAKAVSPETLREAHRLAWNFCRSKLLLLIEPHQVRLWTCCKPPEQQSQLASHAAEITAIPITKKRLSMATEAAQSLHWVRLVSGEFFERHAPYFSNEGRADRMLLENLRAVRGKLVEELELDADTAHDLLARVIFIQFLCDRTDSQGRPALGDPELRRLHAKGILSRHYRQLGEILRSHEDTYALFRWLNDKFNGDLFPGKGKTEAQRKAEWQREMSKVQLAHLELLSDFVEGRLELWCGQYSLWRLYAFDAIPLEFISSIYEEFVGEARGVHYTPAYLVDFVLDGVLPWGSGEWDIKILDPACGSGIFLVKAFQRLVYRWRVEHPGEEPNAEILQRLLERNLFGIDSDPHAVRVASFSLYLAMCDEIDPRHYWKQIKFPPLRDQRLIHADFFEERTGFRTDVDAQHYDLVVGNAPWGYRTASTSPAAQRWATRTDPPWPIVNDNFGPLFLAKAAALTKSDGRITMLQPALAMLFNRNPTAMELRKRLFESYKFEEIVTLSALRFSLFFEKSKKKDKKAKGPVCIVTFRPVKPEGSPIIYICPKPHELSTAADQIVVEPQDIHEIFPHEAATDPWIWTALLWGGRRDWELVRRLNRRQHLKGMVSSKAVRRGIVRGNRAKPQPAILDRRILDEPEFPPGTFLYLDTTKLPVNKDQFTEGKSSTSLEAFEVPQLLIRRSWQAESGRFQAVLVEATSGGVLCSQRYVSVSGAGIPVTYLEAACLSLNSIVSVYFLFLTGGSLASFIPNALVGEMLDVPIPNPRPGMLDRIRNVDDLDDRAREAFRLKEAEWILIEDFIRYAIPLVKAAGSTGRAQRRSDDEPDLDGYCTWFVRALREGSGANACATIFRQTKGTRLPVDLVAIHLDWPGQPAIREEIIDQEALWENLDALNRKFLTTHPKSAGGIFFQRTARIYDTVRRDGRFIPTVYLVKPSRARYWTRSTALRDADAVVADALDSTALRAQGKA